jgi:hypothetical protein
VICVIYYLPPPPPHPYKIVRNFIPRDTNFPTAAAVRR